jgi:hypothetical protein
MASHVPNLEAAPQHPDAARFDHWSTLTLIPGSFVDPSLPPPTAPTSLVHALRGSAYCHESHQRVAFGPSVAAFFAAHPSAARAQRH